MDTYNTTGKGIHSRKYNILNTFFAEIIENKRLLKTVSGMVLCQKQKIEILELKSFYFENLLLKMNLLGLSFILYYIKLSDGNGFRL